MQEAPMMVIRWHADQITFQHTYAVGAGRYRRRLLGRYRSVPRRPQEPLSDLLRRAADAYEGRPF